MEVEKIKNRKEGNVSRILQNIIIPVMSTGHSHEGYWLNVPQEGEVTINMTHWETKKVNDSSPLSNGNIFKKLFRILWVLLILTSHIIFTHKFKYAFGDAE